MIEGSLKGGDEKMLFNILSTLHLYILQSSLSNQDLLTEWAESLHRTREEANDW